MMSLLDHAVEQSIDELLSVTSITSLHKVCALVVESTTAHVISYDGGEERREGGQVVRHTGGC